MQKCIHFDGKECRNAESNYYGSNGDNCIDCKNKEGDDNMNKINELFDELWLLSDQREPMEDFVEAIKEYTKYMKGNVNIVLIDLGKVGFGSYDLYIAFNDYSDSIYATMLTAGDFVRYYEEIIEDDINIQDYWIPKLEEILELYR